MSQPKLTKALVVSHIVYRKIPPFDAIEGPYSSVISALEKTGLEVDCLLLPLNGFNQPLITGQWRRKEKHILIAGILGQITIIKYLLDTILISVLTLKYVLAHSKETTLIVGVDPLSCLPLTAIKKFFEFKLVFYSVDFNRRRFSSLPLQYLYENADRLSSYGSDQVWVVCESLKNYKKEKYGIESAYIPNSNIFDARLFEKNKDQRTGNKLAWSGAFLTDRTFDMFFDLLMTILEVRPDLEFYFAPTRDHDKFRQYIKKYGFKKAVVLELTSRRAWQEFASTCDVGIAVYDDRFGSTEFIEPLKIWDYLMCGLPFIISSEPSLSNFIRNSGVAYLLAAHNTVSDPNTLGEFLRAENLKSRQTGCLRLAEDFDVQKQINAALSKID